MHGNKYIYWNVDLAYWRKTIGRKGIALSVARFLVCRIGRITRPNTSFGSFVYVTEHKALVF